jgi:two-component sensor histidine kinase
VRKPRFVSLAFALCLAVALAAMASISWTAVRLERAESEAWEKAETEERVRLALWRMDSSLAPLLTQEVARPDYVYRAFYSTELAYSKLFQNIEKGEVFVPSPLLVFQSPYVRLHFQIGADGRFTSPQAPAGNERDLAEGSGHTTTESIDEAGRRLAELSALVDREKLLTSLAARASPADGDRVSPAPTVGSETRETPVPQGGAPARQAAATAAGRARGAQLQVEAYEQVFQTSSEAWSKSRRQVRVEEALAAQSERNSAELEQRLEFCELGSVANRVGAEPGGLGTAMPATMMQPVWLGSILLLARKVFLDGEEVVQGCWLDWEALRKAMLAGIVDLLPEADLEPASELRVKDGERRLASLPVQLVPGRVPTDASPARSPVLYSLGVAWACVILGAGAVAALLAGAVALSERRRGFVSAVTHEMRTPLTTFRLYTEMLAGGMVRDEGKRRSYLERLRAEAERLGHLVENVLAYAKLESGRARRKFERVAVGAVVERARERLDERTRRDGMQLAVEVAGDAGAAQVEIDAAAVEQILLNLVDNACKYAASAAVRRVHLTVAGAGQRSVSITVRDHGPGISRRGARRLFRPFGKSVDDAARSAPGVGLGLALSRRFAREMGGDLRLDASSSGGAAFVLRLPVAR